LSKLFSGEVNPLSPNPQPFPLRGERELYLDIFEHLTKNVICHLKLNMIKPSESSPLSPGGERGWGIERVLIPQSPTLSPQGRKGAIFRHF
jgi:hypothetical protein